jgi:hypothetical protein
MPHQSDPAFAPSLGDMLRELPKERFFQVRDRGRSARVMSCARAGDESNRQR